MDFVNRTRELSRLTSWFESETPRPALIWGRRRVGKTALIQEFASTHRTIFHTGAGRPPRDELRHLSRSAEPWSSGVRDLTMRPFTDWDDALEYLAEAAKDEPLLLVLDEFPEIQSSSPELPGVLRAFLDRVHGKTQLRILLCGSAVRSMEALQEHRAPLYGRFDLRLLVHPFTPDEASALLTSVDPSDAALVYGLLGGMPLYLSWWQPELSIGDNLLHLIGYAGAPLLGEGELVLATEVEPGGQAATVLRSIAAGKTRYSEIKDAINAEPSRTLDRLIDLRLIERLVPVTDDPRRTKRRVYTVTDNFLAFYLHVVDRYRGEIERGLGESIMPTLTSELDDHMGHRWESMIRDHIRARSARGQLADDVVAVGPWWRDDGGNEIDVVALAGRDRRPVLVGETKWSRRVDGARIRRVLERKASAITDQPDELTYVVSARESVDHANEQGVVSITAADVFRPL